MTDDRKPEAELTIQALPSGYCRECNCFDCEYDCRSRIELHYDDNGKVYCEGFYPQDEEE